MIVMGYSYQNKNDIFSWNGPKEIRNIQLLFVDVCKRNLIKHHPLLSIDYKCKYILKRIRSIVSLSGCEAYSIIIM